MKYSSEKDTSLIKIVEGTLKENWGSKAFTDYGIKVELEYTYQDVAQHIERFHYLFEELGVKPGDKIAICDKNSSNWTIALLSTLTYGAVAVPILNDFNMEQIENIYTHSESILFFCSNRVYTESANLDKARMINLADFNPFTEDQKTLAAFENAAKKYDTRFPNGMQPSDVNYKVEDPEALALLSYTSGSTGNSKGVMIPNRALWSNVLFADAVLALKKGSKILSMLPLAHMYGFAFEFLYEFSIGCHVHFLTKAPSPKILLGALAAVRPSLVIAVPLIVEKIVKGKVFPVINTPKMKFLLSIPGLRNIIYKKIRQQLLNAFGGNIYEIVAGGAPLNKEVEDFLRRINFPITVGYGMTECAPIICYEDWHKFAKGSCGKPVVRMEVKIDSADPHNVAGEIICRGTNVMLGYYKNPEATAEAIDKDGWLHTGDLGTIDAEGNVFIRGRKKSMLLGANGQNIYPEEIEDKVLSHTPFDECVVVQRGEKLVCLAYISDATLEAQNLTRKDIANNIDEIRNNLNAYLPKFANITEFELRDEEFIKTPKKNIKRYLYS